MLILILIVAATMKEEKSSKETEVTVKRELERHIVHLWGLRKTETTANLAQ
jgi:hypothetical protein